MTALAHATPGFFIPAAPVQTGTSTGAMYMNEALNSALQHWHRTAANRLRLAPFESHLTAILNDALRTSAPRP